jgi:tetratricopeptide (TPR) repeat protein
LGKLDEAYKNIQKAIGLNPGIAKFHNKLGDIFYEKSQFKDSISSFSQALNSDSEKGSALKGIGLSYLNVEDWQAAVEAFEKAQELGETVFYGLGFAYFELGDDERGIENFRNEILKDGPARTEASYYLGFAYAAIGDNSSAAQTFKKFLEFSANNADKPGWIEWRLEAQRQIEKLE